MPDGIPDEAEDVLGVLTERVEIHFGMDLGRLKAAVGSDPTAHPGATEVVKWHGLLAQAQSVLDRAEDDLLAALQTQQSEVDDPTMGLAHRVNAAVAVRDGRAGVVAWLLDPDAPGKKNLAAERLARLGPRTGPAVPTSAAHRPAGTPTPAGRAARGAR
ncbi:hypothetical protein SLNWT_7071 [Streptomyces albus]|uniref:Uncharacterized protein n=1 Tax=Streptomyces albus (strain ATCC 21838 / DSM 41398 / FERM P-419 / JCM 4703 / NBRC 107858) TaxID=1081613 RepID=A0A0B5FAG2_STRA4|nr:hypothetical protein SLNWT_7071 [Streptomyces albus]AOU81750.1 hypothetical protein SLNHY_7059 [Streptomyces albus]